MTARLDAKLRHSGRLTAEARMLRALPALDAFAYESMTRVPNEKDPFPGLVRPLWVLTKGPHRLTAGIYLHPFGHELRVFQSDDPRNVVNSFVAKAGDPTLITRADVLRDVLEGHGWTPEPPH
jgi:hypothetical protein